MLRLDVRYQVRVVNHLMNGYSSSEMYYVIKYGVGVTLIER